jgi:hypothetical protein
LQTILRLVLAIQNHRAQGDWNLVLRLNVKNGDLYYYAILDDCNDYLTPQTRNAAFCDAFNGLTRSVAEKVIEILHVEYEDEISHTINFDKMPYSNDSMLNFTEEIRRDEDGNIIAYVIKRINEEE